MIRPSNIKSKLTMVARESSSAAIFGNKLMKQIVDESVN